MTARIGIAALWVCFCFCFWGLQMLGGCALNTADVGPPQSLLGEWKTTPTKTANLK